MEKEKNEYYERTRNERLIYQNKYYKDKID